MVADGRWVGEDLGFWVGDLAEPGSSGYQLVPRRGTGLVQRRASEHQDRRRTGVGGKGCWRTRVTHPANGHREHLDGVMSSSTRIPPGSRGTCSAALSFLATDAWHPSHLLLSRDCRRPSRTAPQPLFLPLGTLPLSPPDTAVCILRLLRALKGKGQLCKA